LIAAAPNPAAAGTPVTVTTTFTDPGTLDAHTCTINWGDGTTTSGTVSPPTGSGTCTGTHTYTAGGVLTITVTVTDDDGGSDTDTAFITLIGLSEKVTGGGWIKQPAGAVPDKGEMAYFGFNAKQHMGDTVPTGETNFKYRPSDLHFHSTSYEAVVVTITPDPATPDKAEWWGSGTINGAGDYCFKVNVTDAGEPGKNDSFRIRIWQKVTGTTTCAVPAPAPPLLLYDNGFATQSETTLGGGNIQIHLALNVVGGAVRGEPRSEVLTGKTLNRVVAAAIARWSSAGVDPQRLSAISTVPIETADLSDSLLGVASSGVIWIDRDAAGHGWFIDSYPADENQFGASGSSRIGDRIDLLTVVAHELGHLLGFDHSADSVMREALEPGMRRIPRPTFPAAHLPTGLCDRLRRPAGYRSSSTELTTHWSETSAVSRGTFGTGSLTSAPRRPTRPLARPADL
jgi:PKD domain-containing protein/matrixin